MGSEGTGVVSLLSKLCQLALSGVAGAIILQGEKWVSRIDRSLFGRGSDIFKKAYACMQGDWLSRSGWQPGAGPPFGSHIGEPSGTEKRPHFVFDLYVPVMPFEGERGPMKTIDLKRSLKPFYTASTSKPAMVDVPALNTLMVDGTGDPNSPAFQEAVGFLYSVAYTLKFAFKKGKAIDYPVMALEGLWCADDPAVFVSGPRDEWKWTILIVVPEVVTGEDVAEAAAAAKKKTKFPRFPEVRFEKFAEGKAAQVMHIGPYAAEGPTIERLHRFIAEQGYRLRGWHHEIYLGDPRRAAPEKLKTIIRQPVEPA